MKEGALLFFCMKEGRRFESNFLSGPLLFFEAGGGGGFVTPASPPHRVRAYKFFAFVFGGGEKASLVFSL